MSSHDGLPKLASLPTDELRAVVRAVLRDVLPDAIEEVTLGTSDDLDSFVRRVAALCDDPDQRGDLRDGRRRFRLAGAGPPVAALTSPTGSAGVVRVDRGAVTERTVRKAAADKARLVLGPRAVLTPLARDSARTLGVRVEREER